MYNHAHLIAYIQGVWLLKPEVFINLMFLMDRKLDWKGGARPHPHHAVPQEPPFSINYTLTTGSPETIPQKACSSHTKMHFTKIPPHKAAHPTACVGIATPPPHRFISFSPSSSFLLPRWRPHHCTGPFFFCL